jgi:hypothetical protein
LTWGSAVMPSKTIFFSFHISIAVCIFVTPYIIVTWRLKAEIVEPEETSLARQRLGKHVPSETKQRDNAVARAAASW